MVAGKRPATVQPQEDFPTNRGGLCSRGWTAADLLDHKDRLLTPLVRTIPGDRTSSLRGATWDEALDRVADGIRNAQRRYGPDGVGVFGGGGLTNEKAYTLGKFARVALRTSAIDYNGRFCMSSSATAGNRAFGVDRAYTTLLIVTTTAGVGGGNFASSMTNINVYYPQRLKGWALGINAGGGNLGVPVVQLVGLLILATVGSAYPRLLVVIYIPLIILAALGAARNMNNLSHMTNSKRAMRDASKDSNTWIISVLYIGTFGSFIGFSFAFGQVLQVQFADTFATPVKAAYLTFIGPLIGSLIRPVGGHLADRLGGARVSFVNFVAMAMGATVVLTASLIHSLPLYLVGFVMLFAFSGVGNGSVYKMIPAIFKAKSGTEIITGADPTASMAKSQRHAGALIGIAGAIGAFGGVLVNLAFRQSFIATKSADSAYIAFIAFYAVCFAVTWFVYIRDSPRKLEGV